MFDDAAVYFAVRQNLCRIVTIKSYLSMLLIVIIVTMY